MNNVYMVGSGSAPFNPLFTLGCYQTPFPQQSCLTPPRHKLVYNRLHPPDCYLQRITHDKLYDTQKEMRTDKAHKKLWQ